MHQIRFPLWAPAETPLGELTVLLQTPSCSVFEGSTSKLRERRRGENGKGEKGKEEEKGDNRCSGRDLAHPKVLVWRLYARPLPGF